MTAYGEIRAHIFALMIYNGLISAASSGFQRAPQGAIMIVAVGLTCFLLGVISAHLYQAYRTLRDDVDSIKGGKK